MNNESENLKPITYNLKPSKGFTLIELLVVIGIIGLLSTVVFATLSGTRPRARDAKRLSDVKQMALIMTIESTTVAGSRALEGCTGANALTTTCSGVTGMSAAQKTDFVEQFQAYTDPSQPSTPICAAGASAECAYSISKKLGGAGAATGDYQICFWLEDPVAAGRTTNLNSAISPAGNVRDGCL